MQQPLDSECLTGVFLLALASQLGRTGRPIDVQLDRFGDLIAEAYEAAIRIEICVHPLMTLRERDAEVVSDRRVDVELTSVGTERRLPDDRIRVIGREFWWG